MIAATVERVGVIGGGVMGSGIAEVCARAGLDVIVCEADQAAAERARARIERSLARAIKAGKLSEEESAAAAGRTRMVTSLDELADRQLTIEAVTENESLKVDVFRRLDEVVADGDAIMASNTSSIPIMKLAMATRRPESVVGLHFFNPVPVLTLVELIASLLTGESTIERAQSFAQSTLHKTVIRSGDRAGFIVNALLIPYLLSAIRMTESGFATPEDIDRGMVLGCAHPLGPLALSDLIGLDTVQAVAESLYDEFKEQLYAPPPLLLRMVDAGLLGRKTGRGFFTYPG
ncbi:MAG TPA: 3-hydroxybutyryl-CoA dehydrogenase [Candidatus Dormibacteraeota bacterium]